MEASFMRPLRVHRPRAFTLVEILIVVIILGILATIIIGLFQNGTKDAAAASLKDNLRNMRSQLQLYVAQHGSYPALANFEQQMTQYTDTDGNVSAVKNATHQFGPYIISMPTLPVGVNKGKTSVTGLTYTAGFGWGYEPTSGMIKANTPDTEVDPDGVAFNTY
jgi:prepilin-type N-terminal cleavage/methylation domain-containing protein